MTHAEPFPTEEQLAELLDRYTTALQRGERTVCARLLEEHPQLRGMTPCLEVLDSFELPGTPAAAQRSPSGSLDSNMRLGASPASTLPLGQQEFGNFVLLEQLGRGSLGVVFKALDRRQDRQVALKVFLAGSLSTDLEVERFLQEARVAVGIRHPHVAAVREAGELNGQYYLAMDLVAGPSLEQVLTKGPLDPESAARTLVAVARAVQYLHDRGIGQLNLKPSNILLDEAGRPHVADICLARMHFGDEGRCATRIVAGTVGYLPPEQVAGNGQEINSQSDVYSLGALLYALLCGRPPFLADSPMNTVLQVLEGEPAAMRGSTGRIPRALEAICKKCLQRRPQDRYSTAAALADDLDRFLRREPILAAPPTPFERLARWARTETALAMRLGVLAAVAVIMQAGHHFAGRGWNYHLGIKIVMACWAGVAFVLQRCVNRPDWARHSRLAWILTDSAFLTTCLALAEGEIGPLLSGYSVLIVASGLWLQGRLVMFGTATNLVSFALLLWLKPQLSETAHYPGIFAAALAAIGTITAFQVRRLRILARHLEPSPSLPRRS